LLAIVVRTTNFRSNEVAAFPSAIQSQPIIPVSVTPAKEVQTVPTMIHLLVCVIQTSAHPQICNI
jgi:hypothetical protein